MIIRTKQCPNCGTSEIINIDQIKAYKISIGQPWIDVFNGDADLAERFISGTCPECWEELFPEEDSECDLY